jgi:hypothetical protein
MTHYVWWAVQCKTEIGAVRCPAEILLRYAGPDALDQVYVLSRPPKIVFPRRCQRCGQRHKYSAADIHQIRAAKAWHSSWRDLV